jgi:3-oxoacyl-[acyl-carrier-protein] synthase II
VQADQRRVVITGCGLVTAAGNELDEFWRSLMAGRCMIGPLEGFSYHDMPPLIGAEVKLAPADRLPSAIDTDPRRARCLELALAAARRAVDDASLPRDPLARERTGVAFATTMGEERQIGDLSERRAADVASVVDAGFFGRINNHRLAAQIAERYELGGPVLLGQTACSSGNAAISMAYDLIAEGAVERMIVGGADTFTRLIYCGFQRMGALSASICRPFDRRRDGVSFGEGAGVLVLESLDAARQRNARIRGEIAGYGISNDAHHVTAPGPHGEGFVRAIDQVLALTGLAREHIDYVSAHGTGTQYNDAGESEMMVKTFGDRARDVPISSIKSMIGHTNGAASTIEAVACVLALERQEVPPTARLEEPDPGFDLDYVAGVGRPHRMSTCVSLAAGFGGFNVCLALRRFA